MGEGGGCSFSLTTWGKKEKGWGKKGKGYKYLFTLLLGTKQEKYMELIKLGGEGEREKEEKRRTSMLHQISSGKKKGKKPFFFLLIASLDTG